MRARGVKAGDYVKLQHIPKPVIVSTRATVEGDMVALGFDCRHFGNYSEAKIERRLFDGDDELEVTHQWPSQPR